ncbi:MAG: 50S ribosomal protein L30 [Candidatus Bathyarchaeia archaeon]|nr:50S ribosomal protein L30 [Candidatus Bathyarchaeota archaeon]
MNSIKTETGKCLIAVRIRGMPRAHPEVKTTLKLLKLFRKHNAMIFHETPSIKGMLEKVKDLITWGEATEESIYLLLSKRGKTIDGEKLTDENVKKLGFNSIKELAKAIFNGEISLKKLRKLNLPFKLNSPSKGFKKSIKKPFKIGGELGYRGEEINELVARMV